jgi:diphthamide biosynthesis protein 7
MSYSIQEGKIQDQITTTLNACSLEVLNHLVGEIYPLIIGCYQLNEEDATRSGELRLYSIPQISTDIKFGNVTQIIHTDSGVLDGKWQNIPDRHMNYFATANASGSISIYGLHSEENASNSLNLSLMNSSEIEESNGLALALAWDDSNSSQIVSSYSGGTIALHTIDYRSDESACNIRESMRWNAHSMFGCPAEVWTCCFASNKEYNSHPNVVMSGGDDCKMKVWDIRNNTIPFHVMSNFDAGVTTLSYHPKLEHIFAVGSYDECLRIMDMRKLAEPLTKINVDGGVWRAKWHPKDSSRILVGAMHAGCRVVQADCILDHDHVDENPHETVITKSFTKHKSMAYGADWLLIPRVGGDLEFAASCSFYDKQGFIWHSSERD